ncbi:hypothetical protein GGR95_003711 [Sulfitobacter undariae]|uniref:Uncharacterized protein n=1 Tax=Sulfitobacter undariae TaxID=1563671 RepID=A0A7W6ECE6_9RHOB|nr:hypothetical protein [Sulfitobacter undariae]MBB3996045.1 hypothetical protein [Sulfitobacter undariae]
MDEDYPWTEEEAKVLAARYAKYRIEALKFLRNHFADEMHLMNVEVCIQHFEHDLYSNPVDGYHHARDIETLEHLKRTLFALKDLDLSGQAQDALHIAALNIQDNEQDPKTWTPPASFEALKAIGQAHQNLAPIIDRVISTIKTDTDNTRNHRQRNHLGIQAIEVCHSFWNRFKDRPAPNNGLNLASPFGAFVQDYFELMDVEGSVSSCFTAWRDSKRRSSKVDT